MIKQIAVTSLIIICTTESRSSRVATFSPILKPGIIPAEFHNPVNSNKGQEPHPHKFVEKYQKAFKPKKYLEIQYAPLPERFENSAEVKPTLKIIAVNIESTEHSPMRTLKSNLKKNIAPYFGVQRQNFRSFVPGYNIEVFQSANRNSGHNNVYRSHPKVLEQNKDEMAAYIGDNSEDQKPEHLIRVITTEATLSKSKNCAFKGIKPNDGIIGIKWPVAPPYAKLRRIHLNLARVYSPGPMLPMHEIDYSIDIRPKKKHLLSGRYPEVFEKKIDLPGN